MRDMKYLIWLSHIFEPGTRKIALLMDYFGSSQNVFNADRIDLKSMPGLTENDIAKMISSKQKFDIDFYLDQFSKKHISYLTKSCPQYPELLKEIDNPPEILYYIGRLPLDSLIKVSIIGSRECSQYGRIMAYKISKELAEQNIVIISGMARGIDAMAHKGCIEGGGYTVAVLGCGADICYPAENRKLYERIEQQGCVLSEYPPGTVAKPRFFPIRNRIISGLSQATVVIEAGKRSGTSITANLSLDYGREVMAVPGNATSIYSEGTNRLIKEGAALVTAGRDVLDALGFIENSKNMTLNNVEKILAPNEKLVYDCISLNPVSVDEIRAEANLDIKDLQYVLTVLEINRYIQRLPGQKFIRSI